MKSPAGLRLREAPRRTWRASIFRDQCRRATPISAQSATNAVLSPVAREPADFNSYGARRGNYEVMVCGTPANIRLRNRLAPGTEGGVTRHLPDGAPISIYDASIKYQKAPLHEAVLGGREPVVRLLIGRHARLPSHIHGLNHGRLPDPRPNIGAGRLLNRPVRRPR